MRIALCHDGVAVDFIEAESLDAVADRYHAELVPVACDDAARYGWRLVAGTLAAPPAPPVTVADLLAYTARKRLAVETAGIVVAGAAIATDLVSQARITGAFAYAQRKPDAVLPWKGADGTWSDVTAAQMLVIGEAVGDHVEACYAAERAIAAAVTATPPTITTTAEIDAALAAWAH